MNKQQLDAIDNMVVKELFVKLEVLDWSENLIKEIQGFLTGGNIATNGDSSVRKTCQFSFAVTEDNRVEDYIKLNTKFKLYIGLKNRLPQRYGITDDIIWFKQGVFVFTGASFNHSAAGVTVSVNAQDKMCTLNGTCGGVITEAAELDKKEIYVDKDGVQVYSHTEDALIKQVIYEVVHHYGMENPAKIIIDDVPATAQQILVYEGATPIYLEKSGVLYTGNYYFTDRGSEETEKLGLSYEPIEAGNTVGYRRVPFTAPADLDLSAAPGDTVVTILDKIKNYLGNFEYFYDEDGFFHFRAIKNYLNTTGGYQRIDHLTKENYELDYRDEEVIYSFKNNNKLVTAYSNAPNYGNIKNDFVVWGKKTEGGVSKPIHYRLAIDTKPDAVEDEDWRYNFLKDENSPYFKEMYAFWPTLADRTDEAAIISDKDSSINILDYKKVLSDRVQNDPESLDFFLDIVPDTGSWSQYSVKAIGRRTIAVTDEKCTCVYANNVPDIRFGFYQEYFDDEEDTEQISLIDEGTKHLFRFGNSQKSCYDKIRELLYQHLTLNESITISCLPIYWLEVNRKIEVEDAQSKISGEYMIKSINLPLTINGQMSIQATRVNVRV